MTRRLVFALVGTTVAALVLAGAGTLVLARANARRDSVAEVRRQVSTLAAAVPDPDAPGAQRQRAALLPALRRMLRLESLDAVVVRANGTVAGELPAGLTVDDLGIERLRTGEVVSGTHGDLAYAAAPIPAGLRLNVIIATRAVDPALGGTRGWFAISAVVTLAIAGAVAVVLGRRLARPVRDAQTTTARLAAGDLSARLPEPRAEADDELAGLARSINSMAGTLERSKALEQQFLLSVSHDLRTPLTAIRGYAEAIGDGAIADPAAAAAVIKSEADRLDRLVTDLLDLARLQSRSFALDSRVVDLARVAAGGAEAAQPAATAAGIRLRADAAEPCFVHGDADRLHQIVANLVDNALRFARSVVVVTVAADATDAVLTVDDDGPGIAPEDRAHVFERLYVARRAPARRESGSGLGLAIVRELAGAMGGTVRADEAPAGGARLEVRLPRADPLPPPPS